jgi:hypothetical protein
MTDIYTISILKNPNLQTSSNNKKMQDEKKSENEIQS